MILMLVVTGADILLVLFVMQMTLFCWLPLLQPSDISYVFVSYLHPLMGCCSMLAKLSSFVFIHRVQISNILPSSLTTPSCTILIHLGHILTSNQDDREDIIRVIKDINPKANLVLCKFHAADSFIKCYLIKSYCLSLYGATLWSLSSPSLHLIEVAVNKIPRKTWNLSYRSHTGVTHCIARIPTVSFPPFLFLLLSCFFSPNIFLRSIFIDSSNFVYSFTGYNFLFGHIHYRHFSDSDHYTARFVRQIRSIYGSYSHCEDLISFLCCN